MAVNGYVIETGEYTQKRGIYLFIALTAVYNTRLYELRVDNSMPIIKRSAEVNYRAAQMYALVDDVAAYADFVPMCVASEVHERSPDEVRATLTLAKSGMEKSFTTLNRLQQDKMIEVRLVDGPFKQLEGFWLFEDLQQGSRVSLHLDFEFSNFMMGMMMGPLFNQVANMLVDAFIERAGVVYGANVA